MGRKPELSRPPRRLGPSRMKIPHAGAFSLGLLATGSAALAAAPPETIRREPASLGQSHWQATLDLRDLPPGERPETVVAVVDARDGRRKGLDPHVTITVNGVVVERRKPSDDSRTELRAHIADRLLSTRNRIEIAVTSEGAECGGALSCPVDGASLHGPLRFTLGPAANDPVDFAQYVTRFRAGVRITAEGARNAAFARSALAAIAPHAPIMADAPTGIVVSETTPAGADPALRLDRGPVEIVDRDGAVLYDQNAIEALTLVQMTEREGQPLLWVRPGRSARPPANMELDYGAVALFRPDGREIAFAPGREGVLAIAYHEETLQDARMKRYFRIVMGIAWLAMTGGTIIILRRISPSPRPGEA